MHDRERSTPFGSERPLPESPAANRRGDGSERNERAERRSVMAEGVSGGVPFGTQIHRMAQARQGDVGLLFCSEAGIERAVTWRELDDRSTQVARVLAEEGLDV